MGSSAVLLFAVFHSPLSQPWALVGGHLVSAAISVLCAYHITNPVIATVDAPAGRATRPEHDDIVAALKSMDTFIDVAEEDLERIYLLATINRQKRSLGSVFCRDIMTRNVTSVSPQSALSSVWNVLRQRNIRGVPVLDEDRRVVGMVAISDFLKNTDWDWNRRSRLRCLLTSPRHRGRRPTS
jgi:CBS domain-containing membrane protein